MSLMESASLVRVTTAVLRFLLDDEVEDERDDELEEPSPIKPHKPHWQLTTQIKNRVVGDNPWTIIFTKQSKKVNQKIGQLKNRNRQLATQLKNRTVQKRPSHFDVSKSVESSKIY